MVESVTELEITEETKQTQTQTPTSPKDVIFTFQPPPLNRHRTVGSTRRVTPAPGFHNDTCSGSGTVTGTVVERHLPNGDHYEGTSIGNVPDGAGKYVWVDGCIYEGEWKRGKANGKGKFTWKSGAHYEGEFRGGRMEGDGVFSGGVNGEWYKGSWVGDKRHGYGKKRYVNGDYYEGYWKRNYQDGYGKYVWQNGNEYHGEWKNGVMCGNGVFTWSNGERFQGVWDNGVFVHGGCGGGRVSVGSNGVVVEGGCGGGRVSVGSTGVVHGGCGGGRVSVGSNGVVDSGGRGSVGSNGVIVDGGCGGGRGSIGSNAGGGRGSVGSNGGSGGERVFPRICIWDSDGEAGDITCDIIDDVEAASMIYGDAFWGLGLDRARTRTFKNSPCCFIKEAKKPGQTISKGHKNYDLMLNLQLGIRYSVGKHASILRVLKPNDFDPKEKFWTKFPPEGSKLTPTHQSTDFRWKDYCPMVFRHLRELFQVDPADYMLAVCGNDALRELSSPGKSGSFFYLSQDDRFMIKTVKKSEVKVLLRMLPSYYQHVCQYENSLVTRFYGVHCVKPAGGPKTRFIVMGNMFCSEYRIHRRFDLKGSRYGRTTEKPEGEIDETTTLKDLDLDFVFRLQRSWYQELIKQIERDCEFLEAERIMDYSLLVGIHFRDDNTGEKMGLSPFLLRGKRNSYQNEKYLRGCRMLEAQLQDMDRVLAGRKPLIRLGANMPARAERLARRSDFDQYIPGSCGNLIPSRSGGEMYEVILYFGIIDILQDYDISKRLEHAYKSLQADPTSISAVDPKLYSKRFRDFIGRIFVEDR